MGALSKQVIVVGASISLLGVTVLQTESRYDCVPLSWSWSQEARLMMAMCDWGTLSALSSLAGGG